MQRMEESACKRERFDNDVKGAFSLPRPRTGRTGSDGRAGGVFARAPPTFTVALLGALSLGLALAAKAVVAGGLASGLLCPALGLLGLPDLLGGQGVGRLLDLDHRLAVDLVGELRFLLGHGGPPRSGRA